MQFGLTADVILDGYSYTVIEPRLCTENWGLQGVIVHI